MYIHYEIIKEYLKSKGQTVLLLLFTDILPVFIKLLYLLMFSLNFENKFLLKFFIRNHY